MNNNRMHISPLADERQTKAASGAFIGEARGFGKYLGQFRPNVMLAEESRVLYGLTAIEDAPLPESIPALTPNERMLDGNNVSRAVSAVELAFTKIRPFEHGEHASNSLDGERIEIPAIHMGPISTQGLEVLPGDGECSHYTVSAGRVSCREWFANTERMVFDVEAAVIPRKSSLDNDFVVYLAIPLCYGLRLPFDPSLWERFAQVTLPEVAGDPYIGIGRTDIERPANFGFLPRMTVDGYPNPGTIYIALAIVNGAAIFPLDVGEVFLQGHNDSVPTY